MNCQLPASIENPANCWLDLSSEAFMSSSMLVNSQLVSLQHYWDSYITIVVYTLTICPALTSFVPSLFTFSFCLLCTLWAITPSLSSSASRRINSSNFSLCFLLAFVQLSCVLYENIILTHCVTTVSNSQNNNWSNKVWRDHFKSYHPKVNYGRLR